MFQIASCPRRFVFLWVIFLAGTLSCVSVQTTRTQSETLVDTAIETRPVPGSAVYTEKHAIKGTDLRIEVRRAMTCEETETPIFSTAQTVTREAGPRTGTSYPPMTTGLAGALALSAGGYTYLNAEALAPSSDPTDIQETQATAALTAAIGAGLLAISIIDFYRLGDEVRDLGKRRGDSVSRTYSCKKGRLKNQPIAVHHGASNFGATATTNSKGKARFSLLTLPEKAFASGELTLVVTVDEAKVEISLSKTETSHLLASLTDLPESQVSRDARERVVAHCEDKLTTLQAQAPELESTPSRLGELESRWNSLRRDCKTVWSEKYHLADEAFRGQGDRLRAAAQKIAAQKAATRPLREILAIEPTSRIAAENERLKGASAQDIKRFSLTAQDWDGLQEMVDLSDLARFPLERVLQKGIADVRAALGPPSDSQWTDEGIRVDSYTAADYQVHVLYEAAHAFGVNVDPGESTADALGWLGLLVDLTDDDYYLGSGATERIGGKDHVIALISGALAIRDKESWGRTARRMIIGALDQQNQAVDVSSSGPQKAVTLQFTNCECEHAF